MYTLKTLYDSFILPHLNYAILTWGFSCSRIFKLQKKSIRIISLSKYNSHTEPLFKTNNILKVEDIFQLNCNAYKSFIISFAMIVFLHILALSDLALAQQFIAITPETKRS